MQSYYAIELPNDLRAIEGAVEALTARCREHGFDDERVRLNFRVGVSEALANAMLYGNGRDPEKRVRLELTLTPRSVLVRVTDQGRGFDPSAIEDPTLPVNLHRSGGRGIFLIRKLMDRVEFNECGNSITMELYMGPREGAGNGADGEDGSGSERE
ncbi:MAG TPA: ATP-binding protein [Longimicrobiales bacterium]|nr:ATP-binding protein [Longimicrobiales bacterium]